MGRIHPHRILLGGRPYKSAWWGALKARRHGSVSRSETLPASRGSECQNLVLRATGEVIAVLRSSEVRAAEAGMLSPGRFLRQRKNLNRHVFAVAVALNEQAHLSADWREPNQVAHLRRAPDREVVGFQDDVAFV